MSSFPDRWPRLISGVGVVLGAVLVGEVLLVVSSPGTPYRGFTGGVVTSLPAIVGNVYGGYWLAESSLSPDRYGYVGRWWLGGMIVAVPGIVLINATMRPMPAELVVGTVRWSAAVGGSVGLLIGVFQSRAVARAVEAERARLRRQEAERERDRLETVASTITHDVRNPLQVADGHLELLREEHDSPHIEKISSAHDRIATIAEDTLRLARAGQTVGDTTSVELSAVATSCWEMIESADATLRIEETATITADRDRLRTLFENLFRNSVEHGGVDVTIRVGVLGDASGFYVEDDGPGIPDADRERVFDVDYSSSGEGAGIGLSIVDRIAEAHGWDIVVTDGTDGGVRFEITGVDIEAESDQGRAGWSRASQSRAE